MKNKLYLECYSGISGDMTVAALLDLGVDQEMLVKALKSLPLEGFEIKISKVQKSSIEACDFAVCLDEKHENHDHDMKYLHGRPEPEYHSHDHSSDHAHSHSHDHSSDHDHSHDHGHSSDHAHNHDHDHSSDHTHSHDHSSDHAHNHDHDHSSDHTHSHDHDHSSDHTHSHGHEHSKDHTHNHDHNHNHGHDHSQGHDHSSEHTHSHDHDHSHNHEHRGMKEITNLIEQANLTQRAKKTAVKIFQRLAEAEAKAHGVGIEEVHFHEVGAVDSIVDIVAVAICLDALDIEEVIVPVLYEGGGMVRCQHGMLPVPVPAVANLVEMNHIKLHMTGIQGEFVTPTGAAIVAAIKTSDRLPEEFKVSRTGIGAGKRNYERPSLLRAMLITEEQAVSGKAYESDVIYKLETNIDDSSGEALGYAMEQLLEAGARDVHYFPVFMKKNRPAYQLNVLCKEEDLAAMEAIIFKETSTIGIRRQRMERSILLREIIQIETPYGSADVKVCMMNGVNRYYPEYESVVRICRNTGKPYQEVWRLLTGMCEQL